MLAAASPFFMSGEEGGRDHRDFCDHVRVPSVYSVPLYLCEPGRKVEPVPISEILPA